ncbi:MAG: ABC transporter ATP-binding protein [Clostridia bacterium]|nr:ABC transporter ATP-binding protein [Oscillospiraceae bacterium]MBQ2437115.1 ABC transporter ATP-binding protein [Clostridia bacterium]MBQ3328155.1 ABC transporter ATP-binding protein [Clostridia bacterium]MBQ4459134.1 ABC transporter ATP-binding protein [Clostridia bacterium]MBQ5685801.1 ABC transporter ATP-binding protein [Clostridia bacterium]
MAAILECRQLVKKYGSFQALNGIDLELPAGKIIGLLGPNGSGKTTLIKLASGLLQPTSGEILIDGMKPGVETKRIVAYLPERNYLEDRMTVEQMLKFMQDFYADFNMDKAREMLTHLDIDPKAKFKALSKGNREKVQLILVMSRDAKLYLLDEPIGGVDPASRDYILDTIIKNYNKDATVILSTHLIADIEPVLDEFVFIRKGDMIRHSTVASVIEQGETVDSLFREVFRC